MDGVVTPVKIGSLEIGGDAPCMIIAEAGVNHNGDIELARQLIDAAAGAGAHAVKFQTFKAERLATALAPKVTYQLKSTPQAESQLEMLRRLELSHDAHYELVQRCQKRGILFLSTPFDEESSDFLHSLGVPCFKIPSGELTNINFLKHVAAHGRPMIISTGMSTLEEVESAVVAIQEAGCSQWVLLHCVSNYPAEYQDINLRAMQTLSDCFHVPVGFSDHTIGIEASLAAVSLGAHVIEKHFTLDRSLSGPDHMCSLLPSELESLVNGVQKIEMMMGHGIKKPAKSEFETRRLVRKSLVTTCDIPKGGIFTEAHIMSKRPGTGLPPTRLKTIIGRRATQDIPGDTILTTEMVS